MAMWVLLHSPVGANLSRIGNHVLTVRVESYQRLSRDIELKDSPLFVPFLPILSWNMSMQLDNRTY